MDKELYRQMQLSEIKPGRKVRHRKSGKTETIISLFKSKEGGTWHDAVLYQGIDSNTGEMATFGRSVEDFTANFEPLEGTVLGDDLPFTSEGEPFTSKGKEGRNCENCHWLKVVEDRAVCAIWNTRITDTTRKCKDFRELRQNCEGCRNYDKEGDLCALWNTAPDQQCSDFRE